MSSFWLHILPWPCVCRPRPASSALLPLTVSSFLASMRPCLNCVRPCHNRDLLMSVLPYCDTFALSGKCILHIATRHTDTLTTQTPRKTDDDMSEEGLRLPAGDVTTVCAELAQVSLSFDCLVCIRAFSHTESCKCKCTHTFHSLTLGAARRRHHWRSWAAHLSTKALHRCVCVVVGVRGSDEAWRTF